ncbi:MAG: hypothetical protein ACLP9L_11145 [Thermoguttaceae bacterium]
MFKFKTCTVALVAVALSWLAAPYATAAVVTLNLDSVDTSGGDVDATAFLASYGITLANVSPAGLPGEVQIRNFSAGSDWINENFLSQNGGGAPPCSYTMDFSTPLQSISFQRIATPQDLETTPQWSAIAYVGTEDVGSVGEGLDTWGYGSPAQTYTLSGNGITSLTISSYGYYFTGIGAVPLNDFVLTTQAVPEPSTFIVWSLLGTLALGLGWWRKRKAA